MLGPQGRLRRGDTGKSSPGWMLCRGGGAVPADVHGRAGKERPATAAGWPDSLTLHGQRVRAQQPTCSQTNKIDYWLWVHAPHLQYIHVLLRRKVQARGRLPRGRRRRCASLVAARRGRGAAAAAAAAGAGAAWLRVGASAAAAGAWSRAIAAAAGAWKAVASTTSSLSWPLRASALLGLHAVVAVAAASWRQLPPKPLQHPVEQQLLDVRGAVRAAGRGKEGQGGAGTRLVHRRMQREGGRLW